jgi:hypothetical protein
MYYREDIDRYVMIEPEVLCELVKELPPGCQLVPNRVGNLAIRGPSNTKGTGNTGAYYLGWIDVAEQKLVWLDGITENWERHSDVTDTWAQRNTFLTEARPISR